MSRSSTHIRIVHDDLPGGLTEPVQPPVFRVPVDPGNIQTCSGPMVAAFLFTGEFLLCLAQLCGIGLEKPWGEDTAAVVACEEGLERFFQGNPSPNVEPQYAYIA